MTWQVFYHRAIVAGKAINLALNSGEKEYGKGNDYLQQSTGQVLKLEKEIGRHLLEWEKPLFMAVTETQWYLLYLAIIIFLLSSTQ